MRNLLRTPDADVVETESRILVLLDAPGMGALNYDLYLQRLAKKHPNIPIIIEHLTEDDVPRSKKFLEDKMRAHGL